MIELEEYEDEEIEVAEEKTAGQFFSEMSETPRVVEVPDDQQDEVKSMFGDSDEPPEVSYTQQKLANSIVDAIDFAVPFALSKYAGDDKTAPYKANAKAKKQAKIELAELLPSNSRELPTFIQAGIILVNMYGDGAALAVANKTIIEQEKELKMREQEIEDANRANEKLKIEMDKIRLEREKEVLKKQQDDVHTNSKP